MGLCHDPVGGPHELELHYSMRTLPLEDAQRRGGSAPLPMPKIRLNMRVPCAVFTDSHRFCVSGNKGRVSRLGWGEQSSLDLLKCLRPRMMSRRWDPNHQTRMRLESLSGS
uniref:Uncharacterized protein n=1 Tax=Micrurus lemniscatus lemniscatus TaxID=129467 RepID=A0A2D4JN70_MICLE